MIDEFELGRLVPMVHLLWGVPLVLLACAWGIARRRRALGLFGLDAPRHAARIDGGNRRRWLKAATLSLSVVFLTAAAIEPRANPQRTTFERRARDVAVLLDISRSMLAEDIRPNRLERAKLELQRWCQELEGDRVALLAFAGNATLECPPTSNYSYFESALENVTWQPTRHGGTKLGDAVRRALRILPGVEDSAPGEEDEGGPGQGETVMEEEARRAEREAFSDILIITDGEDHGSYPVRAARDAASQDVGLLVIGLGSEEGAPIPITGPDGDRRLLRHEGEVVRSRLDAGTLREMAFQHPRGGFVRAGVDHFDLVEIWNDTLGKEEGRELEELHVSWTEIFQPFLLAGLALYVAALLIPERPARGAAVEWTESTTSAGKEAGAAA